MKRSLSNKRRSSGSEDANPKGEKKRSAIAAAEQESEDQEVSFTAEELSKMSRSERKRHREKKRRNDVNKGFDDLTTLLAEIDPTMHSGDAEDRPKRGQTGWKASEGLSGGSQEDTQLSRVDLITRTVEVMRRLHKENEERKGIIEQLMRNQVQQHRHVSPIVPSLASFHLPPAASGAPAPYASFAASLGYPPGAAAVREIDAARMADLAAPSATSVALAANPAATDALIRSLLERAPTAASMLGSAYPVNHVGGVSGATTSNFLSNSSLLQQQLLDSSVSLHLPPGVMPLLLSRQHYMLHQQPSHQQRQPPPPPVKTEGGADGAASRGQNPPGSAVGGYQL